MFTNLWKKCVQWQSSRRRQLSRAARAYPRLEVDVLEARITPANYNTFVSPGGILTLSRTTAGVDSLTITPSGNFGEYTITTPGGDTINTALTIFTNATPVDKIVINSGNGVDTILVDGTGANGVVNLSGGLTITGNGGNKNITLKSVNIQSHSTTALYLYLPGNGTETTTFTDVNVTGGTNIYHPNSGDTSVTFNTSGNNAIATNAFDTLTVTNGVGSDTNMIKDTDFAGNVSINNGYGASSDVGQYGGSENIFSAGNNKGLLNALGNVTISTTSGQSDTEVYDYDVRGTLGITTGAGVANMSNSNYVGIENHQTNVAVPTFGAISINGDGNSGPNPGLLVDIGTGPLGTFSMITRPSSPDLWPSPLAALATTRLTSVTSMWTVPPPSRLADRLPTMLLTLRATTAPPAMTSSPITVPLPSTPTQAAAAPTIFNKPQAPSILMAALTFNLGNAPDTVNVGLGNTGFVTTTGNLAVTGVNGSKTLNVRNANLGGVKTSINGNGSENFTFTDTNVYGAATLTHNAGNTNFTIATSNLNLYMFNNWNSLAINNGAGADTNTINDTDFAGNVTINNGAGSGGDLNKGGGSINTFSDNLNPGLLTIHGNLTITTASGQSNNDVYDYNVYGNVTISTGNGFSTQSVGNYVGLEDNQTNANTGAPVINGNVTITGTAVRTPSPGVVVYMGTNTNQDYPLIIHGNLAVTANGAGSANLDLNDLIVTSIGTALSTTTITLAGTTSNDTVSVQGTAITSMYDNFTINSTAGGANTYNIQDGAGTLQIAGAFNLNLGNGNDTVDLGADVANPGGFPLAVVEFFSLTSTSRINGGNGLNFLFDSPTTLFTYPGDPLILLNI